MSDEKRTRAVIYRAPSGSEPVRDWLLCLNDADRHIIGYDISTAEFGLPIGAPTCRALGQGLHEVRSNLAGNRIARVFFCVAEGQMVLLHGMLMKPQTTPKADLDLARKRMGVVAP